MNPLYTLLLYLFEFFITVKLWFKSWWSKPTSPSAQLYQLNSLTIYDRQGHVLAVHKTPVNLITHQLTFSLEDSDPQAYLLLFKFVYRDQTYQCPVVRDGSITRVTMPLYKCRELDLSIKEQVTILYPTGLIDQELIRQYAGPLGTFYQDKGLSVTPNLIHGLAEPKVVLQDLLENQLVFTNDQPIQLD